MITEFGKSYASIQTENIIMDQLLSLTLFHSPSEKSMDQSFKNQYHHLIVSYRNVVTNLCCLQFCSFELKNEDKRVFVLDWQLDLISDHYIIIYPKPSLYTRTQTTRSLYFYVVIDTSLIVCDSSGMKKTIAMTDTLTSHIEGTDLTKAFLNVR
jgi:hypothetical protein